MLVFHGGCVLHGIHGIYKHNNHIMLVAVQYEGTVYYIVQGHRSIKLVRRANRSRPILLAVSIQYIISRIE